MRATLVNIEQLGFISADYYLDSTKHQGKTVSVLASQYCPRNLGDGEIIE
jgi:hypothetical protein